MLLTRVTLLSLTKKFNHFRIAWDSVDNTKKTLGNLKARLMAEEFELQEREDNNEASTQLLLYLKLGSKKSYCKTFTKV